MAENLIVSNCRCDDIPIGVADAAAAGVREAQEWLKRAEALADEKGGARALYFAETAPQRPDHVPWPTFEGKQILPAEGWERDQFDDSEASSGGTWITIGGQPEGDKKYKGGFPVQISSEGVILKGGPKALRGKHVSQVQSHFETERKARKEAGEKDAFGKVGDFFDKAAAKARKELDRHEAKAPGISKNFDKIAEYQGHKWDIPAKEYAALARELYPQIHQHIQERNDARAYASTRLKVWKSTASAMENRSGKQGQKPKGRTDYTQGGFDVVGRELAKMFPSLGWGSSGDFEARDSEADYAALTWELIKEEKENPSIVSRGFHAKVDEYIENHFKQATANHGKPAHELDAYDPEQFDEHEFSSTQFNLTGDIAFRVRQLGSRIDSDDLAGDGREENPHLTVKFGLHTNSPDDVRSAVQDQPPVAIQFGKCSIFSSSDYDVVKIDIASRALHALNKTIADSLECTDTHPEYKPHVTIAYVKPGLGERYAKTLNDLEGEVAVFGRLVFSDKTRQHHSIPLTGAAQFAEGAQHAPAGGVTVQGTFYKGGEFIPNEVIEKATAEEKEAIKGKPVEPHTLTRHAYHQQEKGKPGYDVQATNKAYWGHVRGALETGKDVPEEVKGHYSDVFGALPEVKQAEPEAPKAAESATSVTDKQRKAIESTLSASAKVHGKQAFEATGKLPHELSLDEYSAIVDPDNAKWRQGQKPEDVHKEWVKAADIHAPHAIHTGALEMYADGSEPSLLNTLKDRQAAENVKPAPAAETPFALTNKPEAAKPKFEEKGNGTQDMLFGTKGLPGERNLFATPGVPEDMVYKPKAPPEPEKPANRSKSFPGIKPGSETHTIARELENAGQLAKRESGVWEGPGGLTGNTAGDVVRAYLAEYKRSTGKRYIPARDQLADLEKSVASMRQQFPEHEVGEKLLERLAELKRKAEAAE